MEKNKNILINALHKLPVYQPDDALWENITNSLGDNSHPNIYHQLNQVKPPDEIWNKIDRHLSEIERRKKEKSIVKLVRWSLTAAALIAVGIIIFYFDENNNRKLNYTEEWITTTTDDQQWKKEDTLVYRQIADKCKVKPEVCQSGEFIRMKEELEFLDQSKRTVLGQLSRYDSDNDLEIMLKRIETERSDVINQIAAFIN
jgi:hypothetical protein